MLIVKSFYNLLRCFLILENTKALAIWSVSVVGSVNASTFHVIALKEVRNIFQSAIKRQSPSFHKPVVLISNSPNLSRGLLKVLLGMIR